MVDDASSPRIHSKMKLQKTEQIQMKGNTHSEILRFISENLASLRPVNIIVLSTKYEANKTNWLEW